MDKYLKAIETIYADAKTPLQRELARWTEAVAPEKSIFEIMENSGAIWNGTNWRLQGGLDIDETDTKTNARNDRAIVTGKQIGRAHV